MTLPEIQDFRSLSDPSPRAGEGTVEAVPHVVAWNLTQRCNLACAHCYIAAGPWQGGRGELATGEVKRIADEILALNPAPMFVLSGGEPLLRGDLEEIAAHAKAGGATVVVGTNGTGLTAQRIGSLKRAGVTGVAVSVDSLDPTYHDRFRHGQAALADTLAAVERLRAGELDFVIQTTLTRGNRDEVGALAAWAAERGAVSFNLYFLVETGRGSGMKGLSPRENDAVLGELVELQRRYRGRMLVRSKCQPQIMRHVHERDPASPLLSYATRCPCGIQYCRITPEGKVTPCPYNPQVAGDLRRQSFAEVWQGSRVLRALRFGELGGKCGRCEYRAVCGGCRARAYAQSGDALAADESCAYEPGGAAPLVTPRRETVYGEPAELELAWSEAARARIERIPSFVRGVVTRRVEDYARRRGVTEVGEDLLDRIRREMPVDFSKKLPFFARNPAEDSAEDQGAVMTAHGNYQRIYEVVRRIPHGRVATYGQVAALAGLPGHARQVGYALHALDADSDVPWQRVINARGEISPRAEPEYEDLQRAMLEAEGVSLDARGRVALARFRWRPGGERPAAREPRE